MASSMVAALSSPCFCISSKLNRLSLNNFSSSSSSASAVGFNYKPLSFSSSLSHNVFPTGKLSMSIGPKPFRQLVVCEAEATKKKADSAVKRVRQAEIRRLRNKARKSEIRTRMKKALVALDLLRKKTDAKADEIIPIEKLIAEAFSAIDKAVTKGTVHKNTGARRKSRLSRRKKAVEIHHGWYTPASTASA